MSSRPGRSSVGGSFLRLSTWIATEDLDLLPHLDRLTATAREMCMVIRMSNDLHCAERELREAGTPLNILLLGVGREWVAEQISRHTARCSEILQPLLTIGVRAAIGVDRLGPVSEIDSCST